MKHLFSIVFTAFLWLGVLVSAAPLSEQTLLEAASAWLKQNALFQQFAPGAAPSAVTALGEAVVRALTADDETRRAIGAAASEFAHRNFDIGPCSAQVVRWFDELLGRTSGAT